MSVPHDWLLNLSSCFASCAVLEKLQNSLSFHFLMYKMGAIALLRWFRVLNEYHCEHGLAPSLAHSRYSIKQVVI